ncbi:MAG: VacJ family lipoprotein [Nitrosomonadales bacterium]|jgi:phospholipid-binding lipoprotein MlaA
MLKKIITFFLVLLTLSFLNGCATQSNKDPLEGMNRSIYKFNTGFDNVIMKPVSKGYKAVAPTFVVKGINNFFNNLRDVITVINDLLQFKLKHAANDGTRVLMNTTVGILGFVDVHSMSGGERRKEDFGQTLGYWGWNNSAYLVIPFLGPSTLRDGVGLLTDTLYFDPISYINDPRTRNQVRLAQFIDARTELLNATDILDQASLDPYAFQRDAFLQYRDGLVNDNPNQNSLHEDENLMSDLESYEEEKVSALQPTN